MAYTNNLTEETKALLSGNKNPIAMGVNQYIAQATPRLSKMLNANKITSYQPLYMQQNNQTSTNGISDLVNGGLTLMNSIGGLGKKTTDGVVSETKGDDTLSDIGEIGGSIAGLTKNWGNSGGGYGGIISGGVNGLKSFSESGDYKDGLQGFFGVDKDDSDVMQSIKGAVNGATTGGSVGGPWGAAIGGILGLGSSFLDDI